MNGEGIDNSFEPWKVSQAEFRGFMKAKIQDIERGMSEVKEMNIVQNKKINRVENDISSIKGQATMFGAAAAIIVSIIGWIISRIKFGGN